MIRIYGIAEDFDAGKELPDILPRLPQWRLKKALSYRFDMDRFICAKSLLMLEEILHEEFALAECPEFSYGPNGKPYFREYPGIFFNISHCHRGIACGVLDSPIGIDIEEIQYDKQLAEAILSPEELSLVKDCDEPEVKFAELWTLKESCLKLSGKGIGEDMKNVLSEASGIVFKTEVRRSEGYVCSWANYSSSRRICR